MNKTPANDELDFDENAFASTVRRALDEGIEGMPNQTSDRLMAARHIALARKKSESSALVTERMPRFVGNFSTDLSQKMGKLAREYSVNWAMQAGIVIPLLVLVLGFVGVVNYAEERRIDDLAEIDAAVLADELPIDAYLDHGFDTYLNKLSKNGD